MTVDLNKLRGFHQAFNDANGALRAAWERYSEARTVRRRAMDEFSKFTHVSSLDPDDVLKAAEKAALGSGREPKEAKKADAGKALLEAQKPFQKAEEEVHRLQQQSNHAGRIWTRCRDYAREQGVLPADMEH
ncbi:hypothetical protein B5K08_21840 [Rhizobium leguminosarum bv. trifolii]|uniref:Uncharacterized protein n=1 Tax=Rhizobium leguminosarum bv. trifolii TaxID=386 RepID=A0A3E1B940_RHILT|nr:hypothetical protein [Rhizobium leguminosarum]RFB87923.1 hypothetical protein B5K08_21840 [Rhizobium leguminosarum bv. trifolii]RFB88164.1 hypothetical protein B5K10_21835 [Rhizobium leguminosarum bv. trifolii]